MMLLVRHPKGDPCAAAGRLRAFGSRFHGSERGSVLPLVAISLPVLLGFVGLALEMGSWFMIHETMQNGADSAAIAAGRAYAANRSADLLAQAKAVASTYNFTTASGSVVTVNRAPLSGAYASDSQAIEVVITQSQSRTFSSIFTNAAMSIKARAVSKLKPSAACIIALEPTANSAFALTGGSIINATDCDVKVNSSDVKALLASGGSVLNAKNVYVNGNESLSGGSIINVSGVNQTMAGAVADPYASQTFPTASEMCTATGSIVSTPLTLDPGTYCNGIKVTGSGVLTLNDGVYFIDGGQFLVQSGGRVQCNACTIVLTKQSQSSYATLSVTGGSTLNLSAPTTGTTAGFVIMQDRRTPAATRSVFSGGTQMNFNGILYLPNSDVTYTGGSGGASNCSIIVAQLLLISGGGNFSGQCPNYSNIATKSPITLVE